MPITVKEVIQTAVGLVGSAADTEDASSEEVLLFVRCFNLVENEVALDYIPLLAEEEIEADGKAEYTALKKAPLRILRVTDGAGNALRFKALHACLDLGGFRGTAHVTYAYAPSAKTYSESSDYEGAVSARLLAYGTAAEYLLARGKFAEASAFDAKYRDALRAASVPRRRLAVRARRWV